MIDLQAKRARAVQAGFCSQCCTARPIAGLKRCGNCIESVRRYQANRCGSTYVPIHPVVPRARGGARPSSRRRIRRVLTVIDRRPPVEIVEVPFDIDADRREEWIALNELSLIRLARMRAA